MVRTSLVVMSLAACSSSYLPQSRGRVAVIMQNGAQAYVRDGRVYRHGFLGNGLADAVAGDPRAMGAAREYHGRLRDGLLMTVGGLACSTVAFGLGVERAVRTDDRSVPKELWVSLGCLAFSFIGIGYAASAEPYRWDAINLFNDGAEFVPGPPRWNARTPTTRGTPTTLRISE
jgi:hypothetical protein